MASVPPPDAPEAVPISDLAEASVPLTLRFPDPALEREYRAAVAVSNLAQFRMGMLAGAALWLVAAVLIPATLGITAPAASGLCIGMAAFWLACLVATRWATTLDRQQVIGLALNGSAGLGVLAVSVIVGAYATLAAPAILLVAIFAFVVLRLRFVVALVAASIYLVGFIALLAGQRVSTDVLQAFIVTAAIAVGSAATYLLERGAREAYAQRRIIEDQAAALARARETAERLLLNILPAKIAERLEAGETSIADPFDDATVMFADLVGFTDLSAGLGPGATRDLLDRLFTGLDALAVRHGLEKIKTIGDAYMVVGGLPEPSADHPARVLAMGLDLLDFAAQLGADLGLPLEMRIGIHTGPVVAGVIGAYKFSYDLWGDTVNVASRLESQGVAGSIQLSEATWLRVRDAVAATPRGPIDVKGRGRMATFLVTRRTVDPEPVTAVVDLPRPPVSGIVTTGG